MMFSRFLFPVPSVENHFNPVSGLLLKVNRLRTENMFQEAVSSNLCELFGFLV